MVFISEFLLRPFFISSFLCLATLSFSSTSTASYVELENGNPAVSLRPGPTLQVKNRWREAARKAVRLGSRQQLLGPGNEPRLSEPEIAISFPANARSCRIDITEGTPVSPHITPTPEDEIQRFSSDGLVYAELDHRATTPSSSSG